jgi:hypothetical protein
LLLLLSLSTLKNFLWKSFFPTQNTIVSICFHLKHQENFFENVCFSKNTFSQFCNTTLFFSLFIVSLKMFVFQRTKLSKDESICFSNKTFFFSYILSLWKCFFFKEQNYPKMKASVFPTKHFFFLYTCIVYLKMFVFQRTNFSNDESVYFSNKTFFFPCYNCTNNLFFHFYNLFFHSATVHTKSQSEFVSEFARDLANS